MPEYDLVVVPTAGCESGNPSAPGMLRLTAAVGLERKGPWDGIAIIGGVRYAAPSEAEAYAAWVNARDPDCWVNLISGRATCTARDLLEACEGMKKILALKGKSPGSAAIAIATYEEHFSRIRTTLTFLGFNPSGIVWIDSKERRAYSPAVELILGWITTLDPVWTWLGLPLVWQATRRANLSDTFHPAAFPIEPAQPVV